MEDFLYSLLHFLTGQMWRSEIVVHDASGMYLATASAPTPTAAAATARRLMAAWSACAGIPIEALEAKAAASRADRQPTISVEPVEHYVPPDRQRCAECGHSVVPGSGRLARTATARSAVQVNSVPIFDDYDTRCEMGYPHPEGAYLCPECEQAITEKCADY